MSTRDARENFNPKELEELAETLDNLCMDMGLVTNFKMFMKDESDFKYETYVYRMKNFNENYLLEELEMNNYNNNRTYGTVAFLIEASFDSIPLYINHTNPMAQEICKWRLELGH